MKLFAVFQEGVYRHSCGGVYDSEERGIAAADQIAAADYDDYHTYEVVPFTLNENDEGSRIYAVNRSTARKKLGPHVGECTHDSSYYRQRNTCSRGTKGCDRDGATPQPGEGDPK